jgi:hypothetical protein
LHKYEVGKGKMYFRTFSVKTGYTCCICNQNDVKICLCYFLCLFLKNPSEANSNNCSYTRKYAPMSFLVLWTQLSTVQWIFPCDPHQTPVQRVPPPNSSRTPGGTRTTLWETLP